MSSLEVGSTDRSTGNLDCLVKVKAQVMTRDDVIGMWVPLFGGGMSLVGLYQAMADPVLPTCSETERCTNVQYVISGHRMSDNVVVLHCVLAADFQYTKVNPTFHRWSVDDKRFGLTFQTFGDATAFERSISRVIETLKSSDSGILAKKLSTKDAAASMNSPRKFYKTGNVKQRKPILWTADKCRITENNSVMEEDEEEQEEDGTTYLALLSTLNTETCPPCLRSPDKMFEINDSTEVVTCDLPSVHRPTSFRKPRLDKSCARTTIPLLGGVNLSLSSENSKHPSDADAELLLSSHHSTLLPEDLDPNISTKCPITPRIIVRQSLPKKRARTPPPIPQNVEGTVAENVSEFEKDEAILSHRWLAMLELQQNLRAVPQCSGNMKDPSIYMMSSYVELTKDSGMTHPEKNEYLYPKFEPPTPERQSALPRDAYSDYRHIGKSSDPQPPIPPLPIKSPHHHKPLAKSKDSTRKPTTLHRTNSANFKSKCRFCGEYYSLKENCRGSCPDGPDGFRDCLRNGVCCAQAALYHCADEEDGEKTDLWTCASRDKRSCRQWTVLTLVCLFLPCMWCYVPFRECHKCGSKCGCCGARHESTGPSML